MTAGVGYAAGGLHGFTPALTSFIGREEEISAVSRLLDEYRLVTVTGPGGIGKTRLAAEVVRKVVDRFADGAWLAELAPVSGPALLPARVAAALDVQQAPGRSVTDLLAEVLARKQVLLVLDNCEHLADSAAELCSRLLTAADDLRILVTSREPLGLAAETRFRLPPLALPDAEGPTEGSYGEALALFADRARRVDPRFTLTAETRQAVTRLVRQLDGMPLAIELAAARVESLGVDQLLSRLNDRFALLGSANRGAEARHRSLAAAVDWSYQLLSEDERRFFRWLAIFPGAFSWDAAEAVAGSGAGPVLVRLVDCSLLSPPLTGPDGRVRYSMLETLRAYGRQELAGAGEQAEATSRLAAYALGVAEQAAAGLETSAGELAAALWLDSEEINVQRSLEWALEHDPAVALRLAVALAPWWQLRGRTVAGHELLQAATVKAADAAETQLPAQLWLGHLAYSTHDHQAALDHYTAILGELAPGHPSQLVTAALIGRSSVLRNLDRVTEATHDAELALDLARKLSYPAGEALALTELGLAAHYRQDHDALLERAREAGSVDQALIPGTAVRRCEYVLTIALFQVGQADAAHQRCTAGLAHARAAGDVQSQAAFLDTLVHQEIQIGELSSAGTHLAEAVEITLETGDRLRLIGCLDECGNLCAARRRWADAVTMWSAVSALLSGIRTSDVPGITSVRPLQLSGRQEVLREARAALGSERMTAARERGTSMSLTTAAEFALVAAASGPDPRQPPSGLPQLSAREREVLTLVALGRSDAEIAGHLHISVRTVGSHLDRIRDKTDCRRRADLTRFAIETHLV